jgi:peptidoglycan/LPS O-acetylase OafA/YrhL
MIVKQKFNRIFKFPIKLERITSNGNYLPEIDGLRFLAIFWVVLFHLNGYVSGNMPGTLNYNVNKSILYLIFSVGNMGVDLLFVLTGFMLFFTMKQNPSGIPFFNLKKYYTRRISRLIPPVVISLVIWLALENIFLTRETRSISFLISSLLASVFQIHYLIFFKPSYINMTLWAFEIIMQFYLIAPLLIFLFRIKSMYLRWGLLVLIMGLGTTIKFLTFNSIPHNTMEGTIIRFSQWFLCGFLLADILTVYPARKKHWWFDILGFSAWIVVVTAAHISFRELRECVLLLAILPAFYCVFRGPLLNHIFTNKFIVKLGVICFSVYLYHYLSISSIGRLVNVHVSIQSYNLRFAVYAIFIMPVVVISGILFFLLFEKPFMDPSWPNKLTIIVKKGLYRVKLLNKPIG